MTLQDALAAAAALGVARLDAQLLLLHVLGRGLRDRAWLIAHDEEDPGAGPKERFLALCGRRSAGRTVRELSLIHI